RRAELDHRDLGPAEGPGLTADLQGVARRVQPAGQAIAVPQQNGVAGRAEPERDAPHLLATDLVGPLRGLEGQRAVADVPVETAAVAQEHLVDGGGWRLDCQPHRSAQHDDHRPPFHHRVPPGESQASCRVAGKKSAPLYRAHPRGTKLSRLPGVALTAPGADASSNPDPLVIPRWSWLSHLFRPG